MATNLYYDPNDEMWPDLKEGRVVLMPVRIGMDRRTGKMLAGWSHVEQSMHVIFSTRFHERVLRRWVGSFVPHILGEVAVHRTFTRFYWAICTALDLWEPCFRIQRIRIRQRADETTLTSIEEYRLGHVSTSNEGVYRPRGHLGDETPEDRRVINVINDGTGTWTGG